MAWWFGKKYDDVVGAAAQRSHAARWKKVPKITLSIFIYRNHVSIFLEYANEKYIDKNVHSKNIGVLCSQKHIQLYSFAASLLYHHWNIHITVSILKNFQQIGTVKQISWDVFINVSTSTTFGKILRMSKLPNQLAFWIGIGRLPPSRPRGETVIHVQSIHV